MSRFHVEHSINRIGHFVNGIIVTVAVILIGAGYFTAMGDFVSIA
jgi:hypothetical protein